MRDTCTSHNIAVALTAAVRDTKTSPCHFCKTRKVHSPQTCSDFYDQNYEGDAADRPVNKLFRPSRLVQEWIDRAALSDNADIQYQLKCYQAALS